MVTLYAPNGRIVGSPFYAGKLRWFARVRRWLDENASPDEPLILEANIESRHDGSRGDNEVVSYDQPLPSVQPANHSNAVICWRRSIPTFLRL